MIAALCVTVWVVVNILAFALCKAAARGDDIGDDELGAQSEVGRSAEIIRLETASYPS